MILSEPKDCIQDYKNDICDGCPFNEYVMVSHPGGSDTHQVEKHHCDWGYWKEDF